MKRRRHKPSSHEISLLNKQNPKFRTIRWKKISYLFTFLPISIFTIFSVYYVGPQIKNKLDSTNNLPIKIIFAKKANSNFLSSIAIELENRINRGEKSQQAITDIYLKNGNIDRITLAKIDTNKFYLKTFEKIPAAILGSNSKLYATETGHIFKSSSSYPGNLLIIDGIAVKKREYATKTSIETKKLLQEAIELHRIAKEKLIDFKKIEYVAHRGFRCLLQKANTTIQMGRSPFKIRLSKLEHVLKRLKNRGIRLSTIELDFQDKAFIKKLDKDIYAEKK